MRWRTYTIQALARLLKWPQGNLTSLITIDVLFTYNCCHKIEFKVLYSSYTKILHIYDPKENWLKFYLQGCQCTNLENLRDVVNLDICMQDKIDNIYITSYVKANKVWHVFVYHFTTSVMNQVYQKLKPLGEDPWMVLLTSNTSPYIQEPFG